MTHVIVKQSGTTKEGEVYVGTTHTAIQNAINYVSSQGGGSIFIEKGVYIISSPIELNSNIEIYGEGRHTILKANISNSGTNAVLRVVGTSSNPKENVYIHDLLIGNNENARIGRNGIYVEYCGLAQTTGLTSGTYSRYDSSTVGDTKENKIGVKIEDCIIQNNGSSGIYINTSSNNNTITGNTVQNNNGYGIYLNNSSNNTVTGNTVQNNNSSGIYLSSSSNNNIITGNTVQNNNSNGIYLHSSSNNTITGNTVQNNNSDGIYLNTYGNNNTITGNTVQNNGVYGIYLNTSLNNTITGNTAQNNGSRGIYLYLSSNNNTVTGNTVQNSRHQGIYLQDSHNNTITGNTVQNNGSGGIIFSTSSNNTITGNVALSNYSYNLNIPGSGNTSGANKS